MGLPRGFPKLSVKLVLLSMGILALVGALVGSWVSAHGGGNSDVVHLCVNNNSGQVQVIGADETCANNQSPVDIQGVPPSPEITGAVIDGMVHPISPELAERITGDPGNASDAADVIASLDEANVDKVVMQALGFFGTFVTSDAQVSAENDFVAEEVAKFPERLIGFCGINPLFAGALDEIDRCFDELGMEGIKLNPPFSGMDLTNPGHVDALNEVFDKAQDLDAPVQLHTQTPDDPPMDSEALANLAEIISSHPDVRVSHSHCGGVIDPRTTDQWLRRMGPLSPKKQENALVDLSDSAFLDLSVCLNSLAEAPFSQRELVVWRLRQWGLDRLVWSSDYLKIRQPTPLTPQESLDALKKYPFTQEEVDFILSGNATSAWLEGP